MKSRIASDTDHDVENSPMTELAGGSDARSLREMMCVLAERMQHLARRAEVRDLAGRIAVIEERMEGFATRSAVAAIAARIGILEERMSHTATKAWVLGGAVAVLVGVLGGFWWIVQQYLSPLLRAAS